jgi:hypothetical protein
MVWKKTLPFREGHLYIQNTFVFQIKNKFITTFTFFTKHKDIVTHKVTASTTTIGTFTNCSLFSDIINIFLLIGGLFPAPEKCDFRTLLDFFHAL